MKEVRQKDRKKPVERRLGEIHLRSNRLVHVEPFIFGHCHVDHRAIFVRARFPDWRF